MTKTTIKVKAPEKGQVLVFGVKYLYDSHDMKGIYESLCEQVKRGVVLLPNSMEFLGCVNAEVTETEEVSE